MLRDLERCSDDHLDALLDAESDTVFDAWLRRKAYTRASPATRDPAALADALFPGLRVPHLVRNFARNFLTRAPLMARFYSPVFLRHLAEYRPDVEALVEGAEGASGALIFLTVAAHVTKTRVKLVYFSPEMPTSVKLGSRDWPARATVVRHGDRLLAVAPAPPADGEGAALGPKRRDGGALDASDLLDLSQSRINHHTSSTRSDLSMFEAFDALQVPRAPAASRCLPYPAGGGRPRDCSTADALAERADASEDECRSLNASAAAARAGHLIHHKFLDKVLHEDRSFRRGVVKFFSLAKEYGFILSGREEFFLHKDDLAKAGIDVADAAARGGLQHRQVEFRVIQYQGKSKVALKAIDIKFV